MSELVTEKINILTKIILIPLIRAGFCCRKMEIIVYGSPEEVYKPDIDERQKYLCRIVFSERTF